MFSSPLILPSRRSLQIDSRSARVLATVTLPSSRWVKMENSRVPMAQVIGSSSLLSRFDWICPKYDWIRPKYD